MTQAEKHKLIYDAVKIIQQTKPLAGEPGAFEFYIQQALDCLMLAMLSNRPSACVDATDHVVMIFSDKSSVRSDREATFVEVIGEVAQC